MRSKLRNYLSGAIQDKTFRAGEPLQAATVERRDSQFSYADGDDVSACQPPESLSLGSLTTPKTSWQESCRESHTRRAARLGLKQVCQKGDSL